MLLTKIKKTIRDNRMLSPGDKVLVAVSGGPDSICLLSILAALRRELGISLHIAHLDHGFRGAESAAEARFVAETARQYNIPATIEAYDVEALCRKRGLSVQAGAREARYAFLTRTAAMVNAARIATGHTATDQAETILMRLLRGAGSAGLAGIPPVRGTIIRPLIEITREEVLRRLSQSGLPFATDPSNAKPLYTRNRIRLEVLPLLKQFNPRVVETLVAGAALLRDEHEALELSVAAVADAITKRSGNGLTIQREAFLALHRATRRRLLRRSADELLGAPSMLSSSHIEEALLFMASAQTGRTMSLPQGLMLERSYTIFMLGPAPAAGAFAHELAVPGSTIVGECNVVVEAILCNPDEPNQEGNYFWQALFDYDKICLPLQVRNKRPGDWFCPSGMGGKSKKLQDFFVDSKVPRRGRDSLPLLCSGTDILWVMGMRSDERFLAHADTKRGLLVRVKNQGEV